MSSTDHRTDEQRFEQIIATGYLPISRRFSSVAEEFHLTLDDTIDLAEILAALLPGDVEREEMAVKQLINRVSVDAAFFKKLSPMENLLFAARLYGLDVSEVAAISGANELTVRSRLRDAHKKLADLLRKDPLFDPEVPA